MATVTPSVTYWNRVEPSPRADSLVRGLEASIRDPLWFLTRQWQMAEFQGEDAASPAYARFAAAVSRFEAWRTGDDPFEPFDGSTPLEALIQTETATPDWRTSIELGQMLERLLAESGASATAITAFRAAYPVPRVEDLDADALRDVALVRLLRVCGGRAIDGFIALDEAIASAPAVPVAVTLGAGDTLPAATALAAWIPWARTTFGEVGRTDAPGWRPDRLDYDAEVMVSTPGGARDQCRAHAGPWGEFDWFAFDVVERERRTGSTPDRIRTSMFPAAVQFSGMPNSRWWYFEDARYNWADLDADRRELAKTLVLDFMLVQGNDWYMVPFGQTVGSLLSIDQLLVRDVFGEWTLVSRADAAATHGTERWTMFSTSLQNDDDRLADYFILPPSALRSTLDGPVIEEVRFLRDEQANMVWAIETTTENGVGRPWSGRERAQTLPHEAPATPATDAPLRYRLQTSVPVNWIPFVPVQTDAAQRSIALERAAMQRFADGTFTTVQPVGRVLNPTGLVDPAVYRVREEEVERSGTRILRAARRARWLDGSTHIWNSRRRRIGFGEGASGLKYDIAERTRAGT